VGESIFCMGISISEGWELPERSPRILKQDKHSGLDPTFISWLLIYPQANKTGLACTVGVMPAAAISSYWTRPVVVAACSE
jgi:hypothetical protein